jgi:hypothetical protein
MTKEQILEKIQTPPMGDGEYKTTTTFPDVTKLSSYLATLEERLEKVEGVPTFCATCKAYKGLQPTPTEVKDWEEGVCRGEMVRCKECDTVYCNGCWKQCFQCHPIMTVPKDDNKKWEIEFDKRFVLTSYDSLEVLPYLHGTPAEIKEFIKTLIK